MKGNCLTVSVRRRKTVLMDGTELSKEMMWGGENLKWATESGDFIESLVKEIKFWQMKSTGFWKLLRILR